MIPAQYESILFFLAVTSVAIGIGVPLAFVLNRKLGGFRWAIAVSVLVFVCGGALAARAIHFDLRRPPSSIDFLILFGCVPNIALPPWRLWNARKKMGTLLHALPLPEKRQLIWSGRAVVLMAALYLVLSEWFAMRTGWRGATYACLYTSIVASIGYNIAAGLGRAEFHSNGVLSRGVFYPWKELGKFEWMSDSPPVLRIQIRSRHERSDIRMKCPDGPEINAILVTHGLIRW